MPKDIELEKLKKLLAKYKEKVKQVLNPDNITDWEEFGFSEKPEEYDSIEDFIENDENSELDERQQITIQLFNEVIEDLEKLIESTKNEKRS